MQKVTRCLWFDKNGEEAMAFYTSVFRDSKTVQSLRNGDAGNAPGSFLFGTILLDGTEVMVLNPNSDSRFNPAVSLMVTCDTQEEVDDYWAKLLKGGKSMACGWLTDKFGVAWQITPALLLELIADPDRVKADRVMGAMMKMVKIDIKAIKDAAEGRSADSLRARGGYQRHHRG